MEDLGKLSELSVGTLDVANSKRPLLIIPNVQLRLRVTRRSVTALARYLQKFNCACALPAEVGKSFLLVKNLVTAQTQLRLYSEQQRAFGISNAIIVLLFVQNYV